MTFMFSYDLSMGGYEREKTVKDIHKIIGTDKPAGSLTTFYIIEGDDDKRKYILEKLIDLSLRVEYQRETLDFILSPLISSGNYNGRIANKTYDESSKSFTYPKIVKY